MRTDKAAFASSPVADRVFDLLIRTAVRRLGEGQVPATPARVVAIGKEKPNRRPPSSFWRTCLFCRDPATNVPGQEGNTTPFD